MEFIADPNIAYVLLVLGSILTLLAIVTPGTGVLEIGALFSLALSGIGAFRMGINLWALLVLVLMLVPFIYATRKPRRNIYLAVSIIMLIIGSIYLFPTQGLRPSVNPYLAIFVSLISGTFIWLIVLKTLAAIHSRPNHDLGNLLGQIGETKTIVHSEGSVQMDGELWSARSEKRISAGKQVRVIGRDGFTLIVESDNQTEN
ncbi:MAG: NfeD family protein [Chloroflexota bacterium]